MRGMIRPAPPTDWNALLATAQQRIAAGAFGDALDTLDPADLDPAAPESAIRLRADLLRHLGRHAAAVPLLERLIAARPQSAVAEHNLAAALGDAGDVFGAAHAAQRALDKGGVAPETWLVLGRALQGQGRLEEAEAALRRSIELRRVQIEARRDLAQLIWMRTGDRAAAMAPFEYEAALTPPMIAIGAAAMVDMAGEQAAYDWLSPLLDRSAGFELELAAARTAQGFDSALSLRHALTAADRAPNDASVRIAVATALMACGRVEEALPILDACLATNPLDQYAVALRYTAWRLIADPRALRPADYAALVQGHDLTPVGSQSPAWIADAGSALRRLHAFHTHPFGQSIRSGVQAPIDPRWAGEPAIDAVFDALEAPVDAYVAAMGGRTDPMSVRASGSGWDMTGAWSVRLRAGGHHTDHVHPRGWISSALHIVTPKSEEANPRAGWLRFGAVDLGPGLRLEAEHWVKPTPGRVILFPSWMWHGTEPFMGDGERLTIAFDVQPG